MNTDNSPYIGAVVFQGEKSYHRVVVKTDKTGWCKAKVPINDIYTLYCDREEPAFRKAKVGDFPFVTSEVRTYTHRFVKFKFQYKNEFGKPLPGEAVIVSSDKTGKKYIDTTDANGMAIYELPFDPSFSVSVKYFPNIKTLIVNDLDKEYKVMTMDFTWMGAAEKERRARVADSLARAAHFSIIAQIDSLLKFATLDDLMKNDIVIPIDYDSTAWVVDALKRKADIYKKQLEKNPKFFEAKKKPVLAALYRLKDKYKQKIIVTDITGSMYPYIEEVMLWHALNLTEGAATKYVFFNDGDSKPDDTKEIGKTGGLYFCQGQIKDFMTLVNVMRLGMRSGGGGDMPENDVEALLMATQKRSKYDEVILIADNYSDMRDFFLIKELKVPVRVILCGIEGGEGRCSKLWADANEEYLNLAYQTGGSIHTIHDDIYDLAKLAENNTLKIEGIVYVLEKGRFRKQTKS